MKSSLILIAIVLIYSSSGLAQSSSQLAWQSSPHEYLNYETSENHDDPAYILYKKGYDLILNEQWDEAREKFGVLLTKFSKSNYVDDAEYWTAYALKHINRKKAIDAYNRFLKEYSGSAYYDDAIADLSELKKDRSKIVDKLTVKGDARIYVTEDGMFMSAGTQRMNIGEDGVIIGEGPESLVVDKHGITISGDGKSFRYSYGIAPQARTLGRAIRLQSIRMNRLRLRPVGAHVTNIRITGEDDLDPEIRLKMEALYSLSESKEDEKSFHTLKDIALNYRQPRPLREAALEVLSDFKKYDVLSVYIEILKSDTSEDMQTYALDYISQNEKDKNKTTTILIDLFNSLPMTRVEQRQMIFYSVADIGNDHAIDFFSDVAHSSDDYELRREAIYYLGNIGGEKAREALLEILKDK